MTSIIKVDCLSGGQDNSPPCYLLQVDQFKCLLDCGWDEKFSLSIVEEIGKHFKTLDAILLTYPDPHHLGALPYLIKHHGVPCPIYATRPVTQMGQMFMTDLLLSRLNNQEFDLFTIDDVKAAFENDRIVHLNFNQTFHLEGQGHGLTITPLAAGHMVGGTIWKIVKDNEEDIVYAIDYNHKRERHLNGCVLDTITRPSLLITSDAYNALYDEREGGKMKMKERDQQFLDKIKRTLERGGNVLIACDTAGRVLEIALMLDHAWRNRDTGFSAYSLALLNNVATRMIDITMSTIEWMSENILREFETSNKKRDNPFNFQHLQLKQQLSDLEPSLPMTVLASQPDLESGFAKDLFAIWSSDPKNSIIFTQTPGVNTLGYQVWNVRYQPSKMIPVEIWQRIELFGEELEEYKKKEEERKQLELIESQKALAINDNESDNDSLEDAREGKSAIVPSKHDLMMNDEHEKTVFFKQARKTYPMFPGPVERKLRFDDYGEDIDPQDYVLIHKMHGPNRLLEVEDNKENQTSDNEFEELEPEVKPTKCVSIMVPLNVQAEIYDFDFEGRSDFESVKNLVSRVRPRRLILVRGSPESTAYMAEYCRAYVDDKILQPQTGETVDATTENHIYQIKLKDSLLSSVQFHAINNDVELAWVDAKTHMPEENDEVVSDKLPHLEVLEQEQAPLHNTLFINELQLSKFKKDLIDNGIQAEFSQGILYCNNKVTVRRRESGRIHLEGTLCDDYFKVRNILYSSYVVI